MSNLKEIKRKIKSVENTKKTTRAMKLVSTAKLNRAKLAATQSKVYAVKINEVLSEIAYKINQYKIGGIESRFFEEISAPKKVDIIFVTADKGLCGGFNIQTIKAVRKLMDEYKDKKVKVRLIGIGKKGISFFKFQDIQLQSLKITDIAPVDVPVDSEYDSQSLMELEPEEDEKILESLLKKYFEYNMYYALIDSLQLLTLAYNKARQESITTELIEIISGVESMK